jgi:hypothetical protein
MPNTSPTATAVLILNPRPMPGEIRAAVVNKEGTMDNLRRNLSPFAGCMGHIEAVEVVNESRVQTMLIDVAARKEPENLNTEATRIANTGCGVYGRAILIPFPVSVMELAAAE